VSKSPERQPPTRIAVTDELEFRRALGAFPTGVAVVTARCADGRTAGLTINSFTSVSLRPPLVQWSLALRAPSRTVFEMASHFAIHVLTDDQRPLADRFCLPAADKFAGLDLTAGLGGAPLLTAIPAALFECRRHQSYPGGDHLILLGEVERFSSSGLPPLVFYGGRYAGVAEVPRSLYLQTDYDAWQAFYELDLPAEMSIGTKE
jgi:flavin reductase (DIM6/NTAB) family NADH-FMN oxidoreductase RutF